MSTNIDTQNALQIRQPMEIYVELQTGDSATINSYTPGGSIKSDDSTLQETAWPMRPLADLSGGGFPLDGSRQLYDSTVTASAENGKLGVRGDAGTTITVAVSAGSTIASLTISSSGAATITHNGTVYPAAGMNVIPINASSATLTFTPEDADTRVEVDYIVPGVIIQVTNDNLISCTLALRSDLAVADHTWEESEIEVQVYYPYNIGTSLAYVQNDWPITYRAGYDSDLSDVRRFYLSEPITQKDKTITIKGVDASHLLEQKQMPERWALTKTAKARAWLYSDFIKTIESAGIQIERKGPAPSGSDSGATKYVAIPEKSARQWVAEVMNLTLSHTRGGNHLGVQFVDAGIPTVEFGNGTTYGRTWAINKSDCGDWEEKFEQNIAKIQDTNEEHKFDETTSVGSTYKTIQEVEKPTPGQINEYTFDGMYYFAFIPGAYGRSIVSGPTRLVWQVTSVSSLYTSWTLEGIPATTSGGRDAFSNPNGLAGITVEMEPEVYGDLRDTVEPILNHLSLFDRKNRTVSFLWKGDPRMQPLDYLTITDDTVTPATTETFRITNIELTHEGGGTSARIDARLWN